MSRVPIQVPIELKEELEDLKGSSKKNWWLSVG